MIRWYRLTVVCSIILSWAAWMAVVAPSTAAEKGEPKAGFRAVTIPFAQHQLANLKEGDNVDVLMTFNITNAKGEKEPVSATILQNIGVLQVDAERGNAQLMLDPTEAQYATLSLGVGDALWLARREPGDDKTQPMEMASFRKLFR